jgi:hypothetical protein
MTAVTRTLILILTLAGAVGVFAQATPVVQETTTTAAGATETSEEKTTTATTTSTAEAGEEATPRQRSNYEIRNQFTSLLREHPPELSMILKLDPTLLSNEAFLAGYPDLVEFLQETPEIRRNPRFYLADIAMPGQNSSVLDEIIESLAVAFALSVGVFGFIWLVRTFIEQRRWNRLSRTQSEVHNKILDRFGSSEELLQYINTAAGSKFLESAPIPLHSPRVAENAPVSRLLRSIQAGIVAATGGLGIVLVSVRFTGESSEGLFAIGMISLFLGIGFIVAALIAMRLSKRLGLWRDGAAETAADEGLVR